MKDPERLSIAERERRVWKAAEKYMNGQTTAEEFEDAESQYTPDLRAAALKLAESKGSGSRNKPPKNY